MAFAGSTTVLQSSDRVWATVQRYMSEIVLDTYMYHPKEMTSDVKAICKWDSTLCQIVA